MARAVFDAHWARGRAMDDAAALRDEALRAGVPAAVVDAGLADPTATDLLRAEVNAAIAAGAFGSPFFIVDGEPFFGADRLPQIERWLESGGF